MYFCITSRKDISECILPGKHYIGGLEQERLNSSANALELRLICTKPSICVLWNSCVVWRCNLADASSDTIIWKRDCRVLMALYTICRSTLCTQLVRQSETKHITFSNTDEDLHWCSLQYWISVEGLPNITSNIAIHVWPFSKPYLDYYFL